MLLVLVPAFTAWHRYLILGPDHPAARVSYSVGAEEWSYLNVALRLGGLYFVVALIGGVLAEDLGASSDLSYLAAIVLWLPLARWLLLFPAAAIGQEVDGRWRAWSAPGNAFRLWLVVAIPETASWLGDLALLEGLRGDEAQTAPAVAYALGRATLDFTVYAFSVAALSLSYRHLSGAAPSEATP
jgi:hypothetical protein